MPFINLIADQRLAAREGLRKSRIAFFAASGLLGAGILAFGYLTFQVASTNAQLAELESLRQKTFPLEQQIAQNKTTETDLTPKLQTLQSAQALTAKWSVILNHLTVQTPSGVWLTNLRSTGTDPLQPIQTAFIGDSTTQSAISDYVLRLQNCPELSDVTLKFSQQKLTAGQPQTDFEIDASVTGTAQPKPTDKEKNS